MEKIDDFFKDRLKGLEITPSERAKNLFLEKVKDKKNKKFVIFSNTKRQFFWAASGTLLFGFVGLYFYLTPQKNVLAVNKNNNEISNSSIVNKVRKVPKLGLLSKFSPVEVALKSSTHRIELKTIQKFDDLKGLDKSTLAQNIPSVFAEIVNQDLIIEERKSSVISTLKSIDYLPKNALSETMVYISPLQEEELTPVTPPSAIETSEIMEDINSHNDTSDKTLFAKVVDEIRHIKNGEKVDFNILGLKPVDELSLNQEGFIASETRQIKETYSWIKSKITNN